MATKRKPSRRTAKESESESYLVGQRLGGLLSQVIEVTVRAACAGRINPDAMLRGMREETKHCAVKLEESIRAASATK